MILFSLTSIKFLDINNALIKKSITQVENQDFDEEDTDSEKETIEKIEKKEDWAYADIIHPNMVYGAFEKLHYAHFSNQLSTNQSQSIPLHPPEFVKYHLTPQTDCFNNSKSYL